MKHVDEAVSQVCYLADCEVPSFAASVRQAITTAVEAEREACADIPDMDPPEGVMGDSYPWWDCCDAGEAISEYRVRIRARGEEVNGG